MTFYHIVNPQNSNKESHKLDTPPIDIIPCLIPITPCPFRSRACHCEPRTQELLDIAAMLKQHVHIFFSKKKS